MSQHYNYPRRRIRVCLLSGYLTVLAAFLLTLVTPGVFAQGTHVSNPYIGATVYASPDYVTEVRAVAIANPSWASQNTPTFVWMDHIGAIYGGAANNNRLSFQGHINAAVKQANDQQFMEWSRIAERRQCDGERTGRPDVAEHTDQLELLRLRLQRQLERNHKCNPHELCAQRSGLHDH